MTRRTRVHNLYLKVILQVDAVEFILKYDAELLGMRGVLKTFYGKLKSFFRLIMISSFLIPSSLW